ncbi:MAG: trehalose-phosphatase [Rhodospirillales bacterium]
MSPDAVKGAASWALFLDFDGTLVDIALTPRAIVIPPNLPSLLHRLRDHLDGALAIVSGRPVMEIDRFLSPYEFTVAGLHGLDLRLDRHLPAGQTRDRTVAPPASSLADLRGPAKMLIAALPGAVLEDKGATLAFHYRAAPEQGPALLQGVSALIAQRPDLHMLPGKMVIEIKPRQANKGNAIRQLMQLAPFASRTPVFAGDDVTDQDGFVAVQALGGYPVVIGDGQLAPTAATLPDPNAMRAWLNSLVTQLEATA